MTDVFVGRLMSSPVVSVTPDTPVQEAATQLLDNDISSLVVTDEANEIVGILTSTDFVRMIADETVAAETTVADYMTTSVVTVTANDSVDAVAKTMVQRGFHHLPVIDESRVIGMVTTTDVTAYVSHIESPPTA